MPCYAMQVVANIIHTAKEDEKSTPMGAFCSVSALTKR